MPGNLIHLRFRSGTKVYCIECGCIVTEKSGVPVGAEIYCRSCAKRLLRDAKKLKEQLKNEKI